MVMRQKPGWRSWRCGTRRMSKAWRWRQWKVWNQGLLLPFAEEEVPETSLTPEYRDKRRHLVLRRLRDEGGRWSIGCGTISVRLTAEGEEPAKNSGAESKYWIEQRQKLEEPRNRQKKYTRGCHPMWQRRPCSEPGATWEYRGGRLRWLSRSSWSYEQWIITFNGIYHFKLEISIVWLNWKLSHLYEIPAWSDYIIMLNNSKYRNTF